MMPGVPRMTRHGASTDGPWEPIEKKSKTGAATLGALTRTEQSPTQKNRALIIEKVSSSNEGGGGVGRGYFHAEWRKEIFSAADIEWIGLSAGYVVKHWENYEAAVIISRLKNIVFHDSKEMQWLSKTFRCLEIE